MPFNETTKLKHFSHPAKKMKLRRRLPAELIFEVYSATPLMYLFGGVSIPPGSNRPPSRIGVINRIFEIFRKKRHNLFAQVVQLRIKYEMICVKGRLPAGPLCMQYHFKFELVDPNYFHSFVRYLCYSRMGRVPCIAMVIDSPLSISVVTGKLCSILLNYILLSPNPLTIKKRMAVAFLEREHFPSIFNAPARIMASNGVAPMVFTGTGKKYRLINPHLATDVGYLKILNRIDYPEAYFFSFSII
ncbi:hypothetical protein niasHS_012027 [Heterodera schachtii]|uniref:Uncharacterized protein n=1 Tax=Heterodera schachtii TaxID=97005 RepID=A0ABD2IGG6_HETSC